MSGFPQSSDDAVAQPALPRRDGQGGARSTTERSLTAAGGTPDAEAGAERPTMVRRSRVAGTRGGVVAGQRGA